jgi:hypothetical protein
VTAALAATVAPLSATSKGSFAIHQLGLLRQVKLLDRHANATRACHPAMATPATRRNSAALDQAPRPSSQRRSGEPPTNSACHAKSNSWIATRTDSSRPPAMATPATRRNSAALDQAPRPSSQRRSGEPPTNSACHAKSNSWIATRTGPESFTGGDGHAGKSSRSRAPIGTPGAPSQNLG